jgi:Zn-dependent peptidase ImmA (M78 family)/transcriptional regulator with XRE-family HTH domain
MAHDLATIGRNLKDARNNRSMSQDEAAKAIGVSRTAIVQMEAGAREINTFELETLAEIYGRSPAELLTGEVSREDFMVRLHRFTGDTKESPKIKNEVQTWVEICRTGIDLESKVGRTRRLGPPCYDIPGPSNAIQAIQQGEEIAERERTRLGIVRSPIPDMADLLASQGTWASGARFPEEMSGLFLHDHSLGFVILANYSHSRGRKRFSYAHEYAHALLDRDVSLRVTNRQNAEQLMETRANAFAACFLVPKVGVEMFLHSLNKGSTSRQAYHIYDVTTKESVVEAERRYAAVDLSISYRDAALVAVHFGVSYQVAVYRLSDLDYVSRQEQKTLLAQQSEAQAYLEILGKWDSIARTGADDKEIVAQIVPLAIEARRRGKISNARLLEIGRDLGIQQSMIKKLSVLIGPD